MKSIPLTRGQFALVDDEDFEYLSQWKWCAHYSQRMKSFYAVRNLSRLLGKPKTILMHRIVANAPDDMFVDHINRDTLNNQRENLRICTRSENARNREKQRNNASGYKGVSWCKGAKKWQATIRLNNKTIHLGYFDEPEEAARSYDVAAGQYHGQFAILNFAQEVASE